jgi:glycine betaine/proline transport system ATP-binding protein
LLAYDPDIDLADIETDDVIVTASPDISMRLAIELRHDTGTPVVLVHDGKMVGVVGDDEIYRGMLRQTRLSEQVTPESADKPAGAPP